MRERGIEGERQEWKEGRGGREGEGEKEGGREEQKAEGEDERTGGKNNSHIVCIYKSFCK